eukprot:TRINITY_DN3554_c0_g1_i1.p1 TRINITY_DN3554_c0_g1~~TRINITY_DN3554_c0_g1_i1.p1  ORF type:complete len:130 (+),score=56.82 TRINITY_DN3554_c0_g1_i1:116-505(+)
MNPLNPVFRGYAKGIVVSAKLMDKTVKVAVGRLGEFKNRLIPRITRLMVHDEKNACDVGDKVLIKQSPIKISKHKNWSIFSILKKDPAAEFLRHNPQFNSIVDRKKGGIPTKKRIHIERATKEKAQRQK